MCKNELWGAIAAPMEVHSTRKGQPPRMHGSALWKYGQKGQRRFPFRSIEWSNCDLWCPGWDSKDLAGRSEQVCKWSNDGKVQDCERRTCSRSLRSDCLGKGLTPGTNGCISECTWVCEIFLRI